MFLEFSCSSTSLSMLPTLTLMPRVIKHIGGASLPGSPAALSPAREFRPEALRPTLSSGLPFSSSAIKKQSNLILLYDRASCMPGKTKEEREGQNHLICLSIYRCCPHRIRSFYPQGPSAKTDTRIFFHTFLIKTMSCQHGPVRFLHVFPLRRRMGVSFPE